MTKAVVSLTGRPGMLSLALESPSKVRATMSAGRPSVWWIVDPPIGAKPSTARSDNS